MSTTSPLTEIEYPESDGKPMGETPLHRRWMIRIFDILEQRYRGQSVYIGSDMFLYYEKDNPNRNVVPDEFVVLNCDNRERRVFKTWEEGRIPDFVIEVTSRRTRNADLVTKKEIYEHIGVREYFLYDPSGVEMRPPLQGFELVDGRFEPVAEHDGTLPCETLGIEFELDEDGRLILRDTGTTNVLLTEFESERQAKETERTAKEAAEARVRELEEELRRRSRESGNE